MFGTPTNPFLEFQQIDFWSAKNRFVELRASIVGAPQYDFGRFKKLIFGENFSIYEKELTKFFIPERDGVNEKADFVSFRDHVWNISSHFSDFLEPVSRRLLPLWFNFVQTEFVKEMKFENLLLTKEKNGSAKNLTEVTRSQTKKMVVNGMRLFAKFQNPAKLYREPELREFSMELLLSSDVGLQAG